MSNNETDPFQEEADLQAWAAELGQDYALGSQGKIGQPTREMSVGRIDSHIGQVSQRMRELSELASLPDDKERAIQRTHSQVNSMSAAELMIWQTEAMGWLIENPTATIDNLIIQDPFSQP